MFDTHIAIVDFLEAAIGRHGTDYASEYGEPGYNTSGDMPLVVLGYYWCRCDKFGDNLHGIDRHYPATWERLEDLGVVFEWSDEWTTDDTGKAYRTTPDSYSWQPSLIYTEHGDTLTIEDDLDTWIEYAVNDPHHAIPSNAYTGKDLLAAGWTQHNGSFEHRWHPGQDADPEQITETIRESHGDTVDIVFALDSTGQFDISFSAYYQARGDES